MSKMGGGQYCCYFNIIFAGRASEQEARDLWAKGGQPTACQGLWTLAADGLTGDRCRLAAGVTRRLAGPAHARRPRSHRGFPRPRVASAPFQPRPIGSPRRSLPSALRRSPPLLELPEGQPSGPVNSRGYQSGGRRANPKVARSGKAGRGDGQRRRCQAGC